MANSWSKPKTTLLYVAKPSGPDFGRTATGKELPDSHKGSLNICRNPARKPDFRPGSTIAAHRILQFPGGCRPRTRGAAAAGPPAGLRPLLVRSNVQPYSIVRNIASGPEIELLGRISAGFSSGTPHHRPKSGPEARIPEVLNFTFFKIGPEIVGLGGLNGPSYRETHWKRWGALPPTFFDGIPSRWGPCRIPKPTISGPIS